VIPVEECPSPWCPIKPGLFKGSYGPHGVEIIQLQYDLKENLAIGIKITASFFLLQCIMNLIPCIFNFYFTVG
jgi:hypothetical protein